ncbi:MAG TPA: class I tRNA ligase family protein, partial [Jiangellaceae bacterium]|nr:class I tRNA ligase family protein [Jiangellaceae bacterium]
VSRFVLGPGIEATDAIGTPVTEPLDLSLLAQLADVVTTTTAAFDDYVELVKDRAYGERGAPAAASARAALALALSVQLRMFAPILPFVTEEVWSWWREDSVHRAPWPRPDESQSRGKPAVLLTTATALKHIRALKSARRQSMRAELDRVIVRGPKRALDLVSVALDDLKAAGRARELVLDVDPATDELRVQS